MTWGLEDVEVRLGRRPVLSGVTLEAPQGSVAAVVGGDGAGKTTTMRVLAGALAPTRGVVRRPPDRRLGYVSAASGVYVDLTVEENLRFAGSAYGVRGPELERRVADLLERTALGDARGRLAGHLSGGMRQKLAFAMAALHEPDLLVLDEPTTGLDPVSRAELWRLIGAAVAGGAAAVLATTYLDEAERATSVLVLDRGRPLVAGSPESVVAAVPGAVFEAASRPERGWWWRRGARWRGWSPEDIVPVGAAKVPPSLEDAVTIAALRQRGEGGG